MTPEECASELTKWVAQTSGCGNGWSQGAVALVARNPESIRLDVVSQHIVHPRPLCEGGCRQMTTGSTEGSRMEVHKNARTTPWSRALIAQRVHAGETVAAVARAFSICDRTARKWVQRAARGELADRSCRPRQSPRAISPATMVEIQRLRQLG